MFLLIIETMTTKTLRKIGKISHKQKNMYPKPENIFVLKKFSIESLSYV